MNVRAASALIDLDNIEKEVKPQPALLPGGQLGVLAPIPKLP